MGRLRGGPRALRGGARHGGGRAARRRPGPLQPRVPRGRAQPRWASCASGSAGRRRPARRSTAPSRPRASSGTRQLVADVLLDRGSLARESGDLDAALASHEEALALAASARLEVAARSRLGELGWDRLAGGDAAAALALFERALDSKAVPGVARDRGRAALRDRAGPRAPRGAGPGRRAGRPGGGRDRVGAPRNALRGAPPGLLAAAPGRLPQRDRPAAPAARRLGGRPARGAGARARRAGPLAHPAGPDQPGCRPGRPGGRRARLDGRAPARGAPRGRRGRRRVRPRRAALLGVGPHARRLRDGRPAGPGGGRARGARLATSRSRRAMPYGAGGPAPRRRGSTRCCSPRSRPRSPRCAAS